MDLSREALERHGVDMQQFAGARQLRLEDGQRLIHLYNTAGLELDLLPDRGLDIWRASYRGLPLSWLSQNSPHRACTGAGWLRLFNGGLLVTCGLTHAGGAEVDDETGEERDLHGDYTRLSASRVSTTAAWEDSSYVLTVRGVVSQAELFGPQLRLSRELRMVHDRPVVELRDTVTNLGDRAEPLMVLYHLNLGYPLIGNGARLDVAGDEPVARDEVASEELALWNEYRAATPGYAERVYFHQPRREPGGWSRAVVGSDEISIELAWDARSAPYLTQWKNTRAGTFVSGIEPGNCLPEGQNRARRQGRLEYLEPGGQRTFSLRLSLLGGEAVGQARSQARDLARKGEAADLDLTDYPD